MRKIQAQSKNVRELLKGAKYSIDYYQREYKWGQKQASELISDLTDKFLEEYRPEHDRRQVAKYPHYFLGAIIVSTKDAGDFIVDGQQRLTSLSLLLILLRNLQLGLEKPVNVDELIFSEKFGEKSFNIDVDERNPAMDALYDAKPFDPSDRSVSVQNLVARYTDMESAWPDEISGEVLPYFADWLLENVHLVEITAFSDDDAYTIFETMNDRGLSLSPTDMLKGYLLANMGENRRVVANDLWRKRVVDLNVAGKESESDFFKAWLRSQYANKIRERKRGAKPEEYDRIGTEYHRWLRDASSSIGLAKSDDFSNFINRDFDFYAKNYLRLVLASQNKTQGLEHVFYNTQLGFSLQYNLLLAPIVPDDSEETVLLKFQLVGYFLDILLNWRLWNFRRIAHSTMQYAMFIVMRDIRHLEPTLLAEKLHETLMKETETFDNNNRLRVHQQNRYHIHRILARLTDFVETKSGQSSRYSEYVSDGTARYEVEHIWANHAERHTDEFSHPSDFSEHRNRIGGLLLLPKKFNASYGDLPYADKLIHYRSQNLLAQSLHPDCYSHNPGFLKFVEASNLPFRAMTEFKREDLEERGELYRSLAKLTWSPENLLGMVKK